VRYENEQLQLSAGDLVGFLSCKHLTQLDLKVAADELPAPSVWDPMLKVLQERGLRHEQAYLDHLASSGLQQVQIDGVAVDDASAASTLAAMAAGAGVIVQAALRHGRWAGRADVLLKVDRPSGLGAWSYEVVDTKLARETKGGTILQLCLYSWLLAEAQGVEPEFMHVISPWREFVPESWRVADFAAYYRRVRNGLDAFVEVGVAEQTYPEPNEHCDVCRWRQVCDTRRREDDHLSLVAGISELQRVELVEHEVPTMSSLAAMPLPLSWKPQRGSTSSYEKVREQARVQVESQSTGELKFELLPVEAGFGLTNLPAPDNSDVFLDFEGDPFVGEHGLEYLLGYHFRGDDGEWTYCGEWAIDREQERNVFERFIDFVIARRNEHPGLHVYHYGAYEAGALKRLSGRYATREEELDEILRGKLLVDLLNVVRQGVRVGVESYSIKRLEPLYAFDRTTGLPDANLALRRVETALELDDDVIDKEARQTVESYNRDDCVSTHYLRDWLEQARNSLLDQDIEVPRPGPGDATPSENIAAWLARITPLIEALTGGVPADPAERTNEQHARWILAHLLDWHRREEKAGWWDYFRLVGLTADDLVDEHAGLSGLEFVDVVGGTAKCPVHRYSFPPQEADIRPGKSLKTIGGAALGTVEDISIEDLTIDIKKRQDSVEAHPTAVFVHDHIGTEPIRESLVRLAEYVVAQGIEGDGQYRAARDLLLRRAARLADGSPFRHVNETPLQAAVRIAAVLDSGTLPIQGPPGTGKTYIGAHMICELVRLGKKVGIVANSHEVIRNLINCVRKVAVEVSVDVQCIQKPKESQPDEDRLRIARKSADVFAALNLDCQVAAGTAWLWATPEAFESVDVLFVDEAAQMSLASVVAVAQAARAIVLLGDPQQLDQPTQGSHPDGTEGSALDHVLNGRQTIDADQGLFLEETWRLHPDICKFTSEVFYEAKLHSKPGLEMQILEKVAGLVASGLRYLPVEHRGNQNCSLEEVAVVTELVERIVQSAATWTDRELVTQIITPDDILIITPYNAQVFEIQKRLPGFKIGTVDKFQGKEAAIAIYSLATSSHADAPRGMEFLYSLNRLNVATSRAKCVSILVAAPGIFEMECRTPRQMQLANAFCRYQELAATL
jgi:predicted RecB family nuclease